MATTWDPNHAGSITFSNGNLTLKGKATSAIAYATAGIAANDSGDHSFIVHYDAVGFGSTDSGLIIDGQSTSKRPDRYNPTAPIDVMMFMTSSGNVFDNVWTTLASPTGGANMAAGDEVTWRMKNGFLYVRYKPSGGSYGAWNGTTGTYANADPTTDTGGIPLAPFGSSLLFPYVYIEGDTATGDFTSWTIGAGGTVSSPGRATGSSAASGGSGQQSTQGAAGSAAGKGAALGARNTGLSIVPKNDQLVLKLKAGVGIMWPFLGPTGTDTGVAATSAYDTSPYLNPSNFTTHSGSWLLTTAVAQGFDHVRLQVNPGPIIECNALGQAARKATLLSEISGAVDSILAAGLKCVIGLQLTGFPTGYAPADYLDGLSGTMFTRYKAMLADFAVKFASYSPTLVGIELMHEPPSVAQANAIPTNAVQIGGPSELYSALNAGAAAAGGKTYLLAANTSFGSFSFPQVDFRANPIRIVGQAGTVFANVWMGNIKGVTLEAVTSTGSASDTTCFRVGTGCDTILLLNCIADTGATPGSPTGQGFQIRNCSNVTIQGHADPSVIDCRNCGNAVGVTGPVTNATVKGLTIQGNGTDGIICGATSGGGEIVGLTIDGNLGFDFYGDLAGGAHPDYIQLFGPISNITIQNNGWYRGAGQEAQGIFCESPSNCVIRNNWLYGTMYNGISISAGNTVLIDGNYVDGDPQYGPWIIVRGATANATVTNNYACAVTNYAVDGVNPNFQPAVLPGSNIIIGTVTLGDYTALDSWIASHAGARSRTSVASSITGYADMLKAMHTTVRGIMPNHTIIAAAANYSTPDALIAFDPSPFDKNTLWTFHWYPLSSIQGASNRANADAKYLGGYDWEKRPDERAALLATVTSKVNADPAVATPPVQGPGTGGP